MYFTQTQLKISFGLLRFSFSFAFSPIEVINPMMMYKSIVNHIQKSKNPLDLALGLSLDLSFLAL